MNTPLVSVIMPVKNGERFLPDSINTILKQDYPSVEIIVVDGQSTDRTQQIVKSYKQIKYICQDNDTGIPNAKNLGIATAGGEFISFISHDDIWAENKLSKQVNYMLLHPDVQYTITLVKFFLEPGCSIPPHFNEALLNGNYVAKMPESLVARKSLFDSIGVFNTKFTYMEDIDWFNRADRNNNQMALIEEVLLFKRIHGTNVSYDPNKNPKINREILGILKKSIDMNLAG